MSRQRLSLDGAWGFHFDPGASLSPEQITSWRTAVVPMPWQAQFEDLRGTSGTAWYCRSFEVPAEWSGHAVILHFGAVAYYIQVWLNGNLVGEHEGSYLPFEFEIGHWLKIDTANQLIVRVIAPSDDPQRYPGFRFSEIPHGKQSWYGPVGGIWQSVWLERRSHAHVKAVRLLPELTTGVVEVHVELASGAPDNGHIQLRITAPDGQVMTFAPVAVVPGEDLLTLAATVTNPLPWSPDHPNLYEIEVSLGEGHECLDTASEHFGFRTIERREGRLFLNGELLYLRGALDQDYYPDTIYTPPSVEFLEEQFSQAKALGLNCLRCHMKVADPHYLEVADRLGMLIWADLPNVGQFTDASARRLRETLQGMFARDGNHPSIIIWTILNENWGTDLVYNAAHRKWLRETYDWLRRLDPGRLIVDNSPCWPNFHVRSDVNDYHIYRAIPDHRPQWDQAITEFATQPDRVFSPDDGIRSGDEPCIVSEFGNWGLSDVDRLLDSSGQEPWWFESGSDWGDGAAYIHGAKHRFETWHLEQVFGSWQGFLEATQWQQYDSLKYEIESMRRLPQIAGYLITELADVYWEANGLLDFRRHPKVYAHELAPLNADTVVIPFCERTAYWSGELVCLHVHVANSTGSALENCYLEWVLTADGPSGYVPLPAVQGGQVQLLEVIDFRVPDVRTPQRRRLDVVLRSADGRLLAANHIMLDILPSREATVRPDLILSTPNPSLWERLTALGYRLTPDHQAADMVVTHTLDTQFTSYVRQGGHLLLLADSRDSILPCLPGSHVIEPCFPFVRLEARQDTLWQGDWISSFAWLRRQGPFACLPGGPLLQRGFEHVIPEYVLAGLRAHDFEARVHAGLVVGWVHKPVATIVEQSYGEGRAVISTFRLTANPPGADPIADVLLDALIALTLDIPHCLGSTAYTRSDVSAGMRAQRVKDGCGTPPAERDE